MTSGPEDLDSTPLEAFITRYFRDAEGGEVRPLAEYLREFPGETEAIAKEYFALEEAARASSDEDSPGGESGLEERLGPYLLLEKLGQGGQGVVYLAEDCRLGRKVAVKALVGLGPESGTLMERFRREAKVTARLEHPSICPVYDTGMHNGVPFIAMRYVEGEPLSQTISTQREASQSHSTLVVGQDRDRDRDRDTDTQAEAAAPSSQHFTRSRVMEITAVIEKVARALHACHEAGVIHRDVKPGNIIVTPQGEPVILDFGLARDEEAGLQTITRSGDLFGTPAYMSPEQISAHRISLDRRTDVFSLGVTLFECLTLRRPFDAPTRESLLQAIQYKEPPDPRPLNGAVPDDLKTVIETALEKDRDRRYPSALEFAEDLRRVRLYEPIHARPASAWIKLRRWARRNPALAGSLGGSMVFLVAGLITSLVFLGKANDALESERIARREKSEALRREQQVSAVLDEKVRQYEQMSDVVLVKSLIDRAARLWPRRQDLLDSVRAWLVEARELHARLEKHEVARDALRERVRNDYSEEDREAEDERRRELYPTLYLERAQLEQALEKARVALEPEGLSEDRREHLQDDVAEFEARLAEIASDSRLTDRLTWHFDEPELSWRHDVLTQLVLEREHLERMIGKMELREQEIVRIHEITVVQAGEAWRRCRADIEAREIYGGLELPAQPGLVPLGVDRDSGLWEFWHAGSGERPEWEGEDWVAHDGDPAGKVRIADDSGIVLILLPGGTFWMGATRYANQPNRDPGAEFNEQPVEEVTLDPFFIAKFEMTIAQWKHITGAVPNQYRVGATVAGKPFTSRHPVTGVSWGDARTVADRYGLELPTEAQWEYAARAGTDTVYWCGNEILDIHEARAGNVADASAGVASSTWTCTREIDDGYVVSAPVGSFAPNAFGLHDVLGNVWEICRDRFAKYDEYEPRAGDGLRDDPTTIHRVTRGGSYMNPAPSQRSGNRRYTQQNQRSVAVGCRAAKSIER